MPPQHDEHIPKVKPLSFPQIENIADQLHASVDGRVLKTASRVDVLRLLELHIAPRFDFDVLAMPVAVGIEGQTNFHHRTVTLSPRVYKGARIGVARDRFTVGHEAAHVLLHADQLRQASSTAGGQSLHRRCDIPTRENPEAQANACAAALLMPRTAVAALIAKEKDFHRAKRIASHAFGVSLHSAHLRLTNLMGRYGIPMLTDFPPIYIQQGGPMKHQSR